MPKSTPSSPKIAELSGAFRTQEHIRALLADITCRDIPADLHVNLPLYCDFGRHIRIGRGVFINAAVMLTDLGGITLEDIVVSNRNDTVLARLAVLVVLSSARRLVSFPFETTITSSLVRARTLSASTTQATRKHGAASS